MIAAAALSELRSAVGESALLEHDALDVQGAQVSLTLRPADAEGLSEVLRSANRLNLALVLRGGGTRLGLGNPLRRADALLSTERITGVDVLDAEEGVAHVRGGTPLAELRARASAQGWELALDPPGARSTLGGALAAAAVGPRCHRFGLPRDGVLGLEVVLGTGARTRCGGRVVKNVTGFDLAKLYTGSLGTLGVITGAWLRLCPRCEVEAVMLARLSDAGPALDEVRAAAGRAGVRALALVSPDLVGHLGLARGASESSQELVLVELAGDRATFARDRDALARDLGVEEVDAAALERVRELQGADLEAPGVGTLRFRIDALPSRLGAARERLREGGAAVLAYPGAGLLFAWFRVPDRDGAAGGDAAVECARRAARAGRGGWMLESAPLWARRGRDVFGDAPGPLPVLRALKQRFDPAGVLNPGRFAGGI